MKKTAKSRQKNKLRTLKKRGGSTCDTFCTNDYSTEVEKGFKRIAKEQNIAYNPTKEDKKYRITACKQNYCNEGCKGYTFFSDSEKKQFKKNIKGSFLKGINPKMIKKLKSKGAISYCDKTDYNPFHK